jgi:hypothetical protein
MPPSSIKKDTIPTSRRLEVPLLLLNGASEAVSECGLTAKQEMFCRYMTQLNEYFDNATLSYAEAYGYDLNSMSKKAVRDSNDEVVTESEYDRYYDYCSRAGWRLRRNEKIRTRITDLYNDLKRDNIVDEQLMKIILHASKNSDKISAIREYNALQQRITKKLDLTTLGKSINPEDKEKIKTTLMGLLGANKPQNA